MKRTYYAVETYYHYIPLGTFEDENEAVDAYLEIVNAPDAQCEVTLNDFYDVRIDIDEEGFTD